VGGDWRRGGGPDDGRAQPQAPELPAAEARAHRFDARDGGGVQSGAAQEGVVPGGCRGVTRIPELWRLRGFHWRPLLQSGKQIRWHEDRAHQPVRIVPDVVIVIHRQQLIDDHLWHETAHLLDIGLDRELALRGVAIQQVIGE